LDSDSDLFHTGLDNTSHEIVEQPTQFFHLKPS
jgi:hypothetical protein